MMLVPHSVCGEDVVELSLVWLRGGASVYWVYTLVILYQATGQRRWLVCACFRLGE